MFSYKALYNCVLVLSHRNNKNCHGNHRQIEKATCKIQDVKDGAKKSGNSRKFMEQMDMIFKDNQTIDPPHLWDSSSSDPHGELDNESSLENGRAFVVVAVVF